LDLGPRGDSVRQAREIGPEAQVFADSTAVHRRVESARALRVRAVGGRLPDRCEQRGEVGSFVVDHVVQAMRRRNGVEHAGDGLRDVSVVGDRHALGRREAAHHRHRLGDVRIAVTVDERQPDNAHVEVRKRKQEAFGGELAQGVAIHWRARGVFTHGAPAGRTVDQAGAREDEALHGRGARSVRQVLRAEVIDRVCLLGSRTPEERGAVDHGIDAEHRGCERIEVEQIALGKLDPVPEQVCGARPIAHQGT